MLEEGLVAFAEIVEPVLAVGRREEAVARAFAVAGEQHRALAAGSRERIVFRVAEPALLLAEHEVAERRLPHVADEVARLDEVVAGIDVAVVLHDERGAAGRRDDAGIVLAEPAAERDVEGHDEHLADVPRHPLVEDRDQERAELARLHGPVGDQAPRLGVEWPVRSREPSPAAIGQRERLRRRPLDDRNELDVLAPSTRRGRSGRRRADGRRWRRGWCRGCWRRPCASCRIVQPRITSSKLPLPCLSMR